MRGDCLQQQPRRRRPVADAGNLHPKTVDYGLEVYDLKRDLPVRVRCELEAVGTPRRRADEIPRLAWVRIDHVERDTDLSGDGSHYLLTLE